MLRRITIASILALSTTYLIVSYVHRPAHLHRLISWLNAGQIHNNVALLVDAAPIVATLLKSGGVHISHLPADIVKEAQVKVPLKDGNGKPVEIILLHQILAKTTTSRDFWIRHLELEAPLWAYSVLFHACEIGEDGLVASFIQSESDLTNAFSYGDSYQDYMHMASRNGHLEVIKILHERGGAQIDAVSAIHGSTPLMEAVVSENMACVRYLLERGADPTLQDMRFNTTVIDWAARGGNDTMFDLLTDEKAEIAMKRWNATGSRHSYIGAYTLGNAAMSGSLTLTKKILDVYTANSCAQTDHDGSSAVWKNAAMEAFLASESKEVLHHLLGWIFPVVPSGIIDLPDGEFNFLVNAAAHTARKKMPELLEEILKIILQPRYEKPTRPGRQQILGYVLAALSEAQLFHGDTEAILELLLMIYDANPNHLNPPQYDTALYRAVAHAKRGELTPDLTYGIHSRNYELGYPPHFTSTEILAKITDPNLAAGRYANGPTPLWLAVWTNAYHTTMFLLNERQVFEYIDPDLNEDTEWIWITAAQTYRSPVKIYAGTYLSALSQQEMQQLQDDLKAQNARLLVMDRLQQPRNLAPLQLNRALNLRVRKTDKELADDDPRSLRIPSLEDIDCLGRNLRSSYRSKKQPNGPVASDFPNPTKWLSFVD